MDIPESAATTRLALHRPTCRNGHALTHRNTRTRKSGVVRCLDCVERHVPRMVAECARCHAEFERTKSPYCDECRVLRGLLRAARPQKAAKHRTCATCQVAKPLEANFRVPGWSRQTHAGQPLYLPVCSDCRADTDDDAPADSPYELARHDVEAQYGVPSAEWMTAREHPLNMLHLALAVQRNNATLERPGAEHIPVGVIWNEEHARSLALRAGFSPIAEQMAA